MLQDKVAAVKFELNFPLSAKVNYTKNLCAFFRAEVVYRFAFVYFQRVYCAICCFSVFWFFIDL